MKVETELFYGSLKQLNPEPTPTIMEVNNKTPSYSNIRSFVFHTAVGDLNADMTFKLI